MDITFLSDTHSSHKAIPEHWLPGGDVICHIGDFSIRGYIEEGLEFLNWLESLDQYKYKIFVGGNHDICLDDNHYEQAKQRERYVKKMQKPEFAFKDHIPDNVIYLENEATTIEGVKFWGSPITSPKAWLAFNWGEELRAETWKTIPQDVDVLLTHSPPHGILDTVNSAAKNIGCPFLTDRTFDIKPKIHAFGHVHERHGAEKRNDILFLNCSIKNHEYIIKNKPHLITLENGVANLVQK